MTGTFSCNVNFVSANVSNFNLSVSGGGHNASIASGLGSFSGNTSHFTLSSGTYTINSNAATGSASGSVYGSNGEAMGGIWNMGYGGYKAHGIFQGTKKRTEQNISNKGGTTVPLLLQFIGRFYDSHQVIDGKKKQTDLRWLKTAIRFCFICRSLCPCSFIHPSSRFPHCVNCRSHQPERQHLLRFPFMG